MEILNNTTGFHIEPYKNNEQRQVERLTVMLKKMAEILDKHFTVIEELGERINAVSNDVYRIAPELEMIDTVADSEEEAQGMIDAYMNHRTYL